MGEDDSELKLPPILREVQLTLVPDTVSSYNDVLYALRRTLQVCELLSNQHDLIKNSFSLRLALIQHLFVEVIPLPLPWCMRQEAKCFWRHKRIKRATQLEVMKMLGLVARHLMVTILYFIDSLLIITAFTYTNPMF